MRFLRITILSFLAFLALLTSCATHQSKRTTRAPHECEDVPAAARNTRPGVYSTERPGIATQWGEERADQVTSTDFSRATQRKPASVLTLYYNDERGAEAMKRGREAHLTTAAANTRDGFATFSIIDRHGKPLKAWQIDDALIAIGKKGERYQLAVRNNTNTRLEMVMTVDGLDVLAGQPGSFSHRGYIVQPGASYRVPGYRINDSTVAVFRFSTVTASYAQLLSGNTRNVGVVGIAIFSEKSTTPSVLESTTLETLDANPFPISPGQYAKP